jgi:anti-anti-sigma factor
MDGDWLSEPRVLSMTSRRDGHRAVVELVGELDLDGSGHLAREVASVLGDPVEIVDIDAARLTFTDSSGLRSLLQARDAAAHTGATLRLSAVSPEVARILDIAGLTDVLLRRDPSVP